MTTSSPPESGATAIHVAGGTATSGIGRILSGTFEIQTLDQARKLAATLSLACPEPRSTAIGLAELLINAIEHGNLGITFDEKSDLLEMGGWTEEIERRLSLPENSDKSVTIEFETTGDHLRFRIKDDGEGLDPAPYMAFASMRAADAHGEAFRWWRISASIGSRTSDAATKSSRPFRVAPPGKPADDRHVSRGRPAGLALGGPVVGTPRQGAYLRMGRLPSPDLDAADPEAARNRFRSHRLDARRRRFPGAGMAGSLTERI